MENSKTIRRDEMYHHYREKYPNTVLEISDYFYVDDETIGLVTSDGHRYFYKDTVSMIIDPNFLKTMGVDLS